jgi:photosystem II stability/assembly factor-like uncharacterized protein
MIGALAVALLFQTGAARPISPVSACASQEPAALATAVVVEPQDADRAFAVAATVYRATGRGDCLAPSDAGLDPRSPFFRPVDSAGLTIDPQQPEVLYLGAGQGVFKSIDGGETWEPRSSGIVFNLNEAGVYPVAVDPARPNVVYAGGWFGLFKTVNGGDHWTPVNDGFLVVAAPGASEFAFDPRNTDIVYVASIGLFKTTNGGGLWMRMDQGLPGSYVHTVAVDWANPDVVYAGLDEGLFRSGDAAESWQAQGLSGRVLYRVKQDPSDPAILFAGTDAGAFRSGDGGDSWLLMTAPFQETRVTDIAVAASEPSTIYVATAIGVFRSRDGGASWKPLGIVERVTRVLPPRSLEP